MLINKSNKMLTQTSNKEKKKQICKLTSPRFENPSSWVDTIKHQTRKPEKKNKIKKKKKKRKKIKTEKQTKKQCVTVTRWCGLAELGAVKYSVRR